MLRTSGLKPLIFRSQVITETIEISFSCVTSVTSTDGKTLTGHLPENSIQAYSAIARSHPAAHEQALRLLIGSTQQQAATKGLGIEPIFCLFTGQTYRLMMRLVAKP